MKEIRPKSDIHTTVSMPGSKSISHRALIAASLARGRSLLRGLLDSDDTRLTAQALTTLGAKISATRDEMSVWGMGGKFPTPDGEEEIFLGNSGTSYRLLLSVIALSKGRYLLTGSPRMNQRPIGDLVEALKKLGVDLRFTAQTGFPPIRIQAHGIKGGTVSIRGDKSSQYLSSLLMAGPYAEGDMEIEVKGDLVSKPYVDITLDVMNRFGVSVFQKGRDHFSVPSGQRYASREFTVEGDISSASYFWAAAAITGGTLVTKNIFPFATVQGDIALLDILEKMGCTVQKKEDRVTVSGGALRGIEVDMGAIPDMVPTLTAVALFAKGKTVIRNVPHLHHKESNRIEDVAREYRRLGGHVEPLGDGLIIHGQSPLKGAEVDPHDDHRLAMSLSIIGLKIPGIRLGNEACVSKSFPTFWELFDRL